MQAPSPMDPQVVEEVAAVAVRQNLDESLLQSLRSAWPGVHFSYCMDDDVCGVEPVRALPGVNLYLVNGREHCLSLTTDPATATGLLLAEVDDDDD